MPPESGAPADVEREVRRVLAAGAYARNQVRFTDRRITGFDCLVASRQGLFAVSRHGAKRLAYGLFFGLRRHGDMLFLFETCDPRRGPSRMGRIVRIRIAGDRLHDETVIATGLDNQCHQLALIGPHLCVVDTANQAIVRLLHDGTMVDTLRPFGDPDRDGYHHANSIAHYGDETIVMLHNGGRGQDRPSELVRFDSHWRITSRQYLPGTGCHDIVADEAGVLWHCGSMTGELFNSQGLRHKVSDQLTRGIAFRPGEMIVGTSQFAWREERNTLGGSVLFLDRDLNRIAEVEVAGAPTEIVAL